MSDNVDPDKMPCSAAYDLGLLYLLRPLCPNILGKYNNFR